MDHLKGTSAKAVSGRACLLAETSPLLFTSKDLKMPRSLFYCPHFLMVPSVALCGLRKMQLKWLYLLRQRCFHMPDTQKQSPKPASAQKWDLALPWHACQNESGGWHTGSQIWVKECVCMCVCGIKTHPVHEIVPRCQRKCTTGLIRRIMALLFLTTKPSLSF